MDDYLTILRREFDAETAPARRSGPAIGADGDGVPEAHGKGMGEIGTGQRDALRPSRGVGERCEARSAATVRRGHLIERASDGSPAA